MATFRFDLTAGSRRLRFRINEKPDVDYLLDAAGLESLIARLGKMRSQMDPPIAGNNDPLPTGGTHEVMSGARMALSVQGDAFTLRIHDCRYGWLHYEINRASAAVLAGFLTTEAARINPPIAGAPLH